MDTRVLVYTHPQCGYSEALKDRLDAEGTTYEEIDLAQRPDAWATVEELAGGERITPVMVMGDTVTVGFFGAG